MASLVNQNNITNSSKFKDSHLFENRPRMLKDFLRDDSLHSCPSSSSSSNGFKMYPRKRTCNKSKVQLPDSKSMVLLRSQSKKAAATTLSALQKVISVVKFFPFTSVKYSPLAVHKRISSKLSKSSKDKNDISLPEKVIVKDILRWRSFRDLVEEGSTPLDFSSSTATTTSCSRRSSWCESDFTAEDWCGENENQELLGKKCFIGHEHGTNIAALRNISKEGWSFEEYEQQSPVSVLKSTFRENEKRFSPFHQSYGNTHEKTIFQEEEEKTLLLLSRIIKESSLVDNRENHMNYLILDDFMHEISTNGKLLDFEFDCEILRNVKSWMNGEYNESYEWELEDKREAYVKDMEKGVQWNKFKHEQEDISKELEIMILNELLDELLNDLLVNSN